MVAEGFEAGGHNGREETTTLCLIPAVRKATSLPLIAAGGVGSGRAMLATTALGAEGVQVGSLFALALESSANDLFKKKCLSLGEGDTKLVLKKISPVRLAKNVFRDEVEELENRGATAEELKDLLGKGRAKKAIFEGDLDNGEVEIGQVSALIDKEMSVKEIVEMLVREYKEAVNSLTANVYY